MGSIEMKILIKVQGDLATGTASRLYGSRASDHDDRYCCAIDGPQD